MPTTRCPKPTPVHRASFERRYDLLTRSGRHVKKQKNLRSRTLAAAVSDTVTKCALETMKIILIWDS